MRHIPYWNAVLQEDYCREDGEPWPCLDYREHAPLPCKCSHAGVLHTRQDGQCWIAACGCATYRPDDGADVRRLMDMERYDPSPDPIDRRIQ